MPNYDRPVKATLHVHLDNGEQWEATDADYAKFNLVDRHRAYMAFDNALRDALGDLAGRDITDSQLNPLRYLVEIAIAHPDLLNHSEHEGWKDVADLERRLLATKEVPA